MPITLHELLALLIIGAIVLIIAWQLIRRDERKQEAAIVQEEYTSSSILSGYEYTLEIKARMTDANAAILETWIDRERREITKPIDTEALEASLQDEDSQQEGRLETLDGEIESEQRKLMRLHGDRVNKLHWDRALRLGSEKDEDE